MADKQAKADAEAIKLAARQSATFLSILSDLGEDYPLFREQVERLAFQNMWHESILQEVATPVAVRDSVQFKQDVKNAYILLVTKTNKHEVSSVVKDLPLGEAKTGWKRLHDHFNRQTHGGREDAGNTFNQVSMGNTHTNIMQWCALVVANGKALKAVSPGFDETRVLTKLLSGLLHEFDNVKTNLEEKEN